MIETKNFNALNNKELSEINGGSWLGDAIDWIGEKLSDLWEWMKDHDLGDGRTGGKFPI
ncbi:bacteriocin [Porphyromonas levii]|uniref:bacteriocin n=1 Tax=Porphyromonas levii TaxID=28114 RepID=UPI00036314E0|nr:bacteriocin [Porphyromonas levii]